MNWLLAVHKHGRHNAGATVSVVVIRIHLFKSIQEGTGEHWVFQVEQISSAIKLKEKKGNSAPDDPPDDEAVGQPTHPWFFVLCFIYFFYDSRRQQPARPYPSRWGASIIVDGS